MRWIQCKKTIIFGIIASIIIMSLSMFEGNQNTTYSSSHAPNKNAIHLENKSYDISGRLADNSAACVNTTSADAVSRIVVRFLYSARILRLEREGMRTFLHAIFSVMLKVSAFSLSLYFIFLFVLTFLNAQTHSLIRFIHATDGKKRSILMYN